MTDATPTYPKRPGHFAHKFCRLLAKATVANDLGAETCWLLTVIAHTEDAKGYKGPVLFHNGQLMAFCGFTSEDKLDRVRKKAVAAGWLHHTHGKRGVAARYWVLIPAEQAGKDDLPSDERPDKYEASHPAKPESQPPKSAPLSAGDVRAVCGPSAPLSAGDVGGNVRNSSSLHLNPHPHQDERQQSPPVVNPEPFDPLRADEAARKAFEQCWNASGLRKFSRLSHNLQSRLKALLLNADWARDYPAAIERAGKIPWLRDGTGRQRGAYDVGEFLRDDEECRKILDGVYDPSAPLPKPKIHNPDPPAKDPMERMREMIAEEAAAKAAAQSKPTEGAA